MAIYSEDECKEVIGRIKQKIAELKIEMGETLRKKKFPDLKNNAILDCLKRIVCFARSR